MKRKSSDPEFKVTKSELLEKASESLATNGDLGEFWQWAQWMREQGWLPFPHRLVVQWLSEEGYAQWVNIEAQRKIDELDKVPDRQVFRWKD